MTALSVSTRRDRGRVDPGQDGTGGPLTTRRTCRTWSRCGQLPDSRTITHRADHFRGHLDQPGPPGAGETSSQMASIDMIL
jgi:hypothetical protein